MSQIFLKFVFSRGNCRIYHKNHVKIIVQVTKNKDSLRELCLERRYLPNRPGNHQKYNSLLENIKKEYEGRAGGNRGTSRSDNGEGIVQQLGTSTPCITCSGVPSAQERHKELKRQVTGARG